MVDPTFVLTHHPTDEEWSQRASSRLEQLAPVERWTLQNGSGLARTPRFHEVLRTARFVVLVVSRAFLTSSELSRFGLPLLESRRRDRQAETIALLIEPCSELAHAVLKDIPTRTFDDLPPRAEEADVEAFLTRLTAEIGKTYRRAPAFAGAPADTQNIDSLFDQIYTDNYATLVAFFGRRGLDPETSRDMAQKTMLRAYRGLGGFEGRASTRGWILRIATHVWCNWIRDHRGTLKRGPGESSLEEAHEQGLEIAEEQGFWPRQGQDPERLAVEKQAQERIRERISGLSSRQQECILKWLEGWSYQEMADEQGVSIQTIRGSLHKAKSRIARELRHDFRTSPVEASTGPPSSPPARTEVRP